MFGLPCCIRTIVRRVLHVPSFPCFPNGLARVSTALLALSATAMAQGKVATTTTLKMTAGTAQVSSVAAGTVVTLTATVTPASGTIKAGQVNFCDATATRCTDIHLLGTSQVTSSGKAVLKLRPGIGSHTYKAVFVGTNINIASSSGSSALAVTGSYPTTTTLQQSGYPNHYDLTATVSGVTNSPSVPAPTGSVSFLDTSNNNALVGTATLGSATSGMGFGGSSVATSVFEPMGIATADLNEDGIMDLVVPTGTAGTTMSILLGKGDGSFDLLPTSPTVGGYPYQVVAADFNGDGVPDLAVMSVYQTAVNILLGNGDGTFTAKPDLAGSSPKWLATGDFNGDGLPDLAVVNPTSVLIFLSNGDGTFTAGTSVVLPSGVVPNAIAVGDLNNDGIADLAVVTWLNQSSSVSIFLGKGDGTFAATPSSPAAGASAAGIALGDFNGDGNLDLAVTEYTPSNNQAVAILLGNGDGSFKPAVYCTGQWLNFQSVTVADLNGDGIADLVVGQFWNGAGEFFLGKGDGTFQNGAPIVPSASTTISTTLSSGFIAVADYDGDGVPDLAIPQTNPNGAVDVLLTQNTQTLTAALNDTAPAGPGTHQVVASYPGDKNYLGSVSAAVSLDSQVETPVLSLAAGTFTSVQTLTISDSTAGATIYYEEAGPQSTAGFVAYTGPITLSNAGATSIQAYATETGYQQSNYVSALYTLVLPPTPPPSISLSAGYYPSPQTATITDSAAGAKIYYTTNGTVPTLNSTLYAGPISISSSETLVAAAVAYGFAPSTPMAAQYVIGSSPASLIYTVAGSGTYGYSGDGGPATLAQLNYATSVVEDAAGNLYIADQGNHMVRKVAANTGIITTLAGTGNAGYSGDNGAAASANLSSPSSLALDALGNLFIADSGNGTIRKVNLASGIITTYAGNPTGSQPADGATAMSVTFSPMGGIAIDASRNVYVSAQSVGRVMEINDGTGLISTIAGTGAYGYSGDGGLATSAIFRTPAGIAFDAEGNLYIADRGNDIIRKVAAVNSIIDANSIITLVAGAAPAAYLNPYGGYSGDGGPATSAQLNGPLAVTLDNSGNLYIVDTYNGAIRLVKGSTGIITTVAGNGQYCSSYGGDGGNATSASLCYPYGAAVDSAGHMFIADGYHYTIREVFPPATPPSAQTAAPTFSVSGGTYNTPQTITISDSTPGASIYVTVNGQVPTTALSPQYSFPLALAGAANVQAIATAPGYETSSLSSVTYKVTAFAPIISTVTGDGKYGYPGTGGPALSAEFGVLEGLVLDAAGDIYVADQQNCVIWKIAKSTGIVSLYAGTGSPGYSGDGGSATSATLSYPTGLALDGAGNLYIADTSNNVIRKITAATGIISTVAGSNYLPIGNNGDGGPATQASILGPNAIAFDSTGNLYIGDTGHYQIRKISATTGIISTVAGIGTFGNSGDGGLATQAQLQSTFELAIDSVGNLFIGGGNDKIRKVTAATGVISTVAGFKDLTGNTGDDGPAVSAEIAPAWLAVDAADNLYVASWPAEIRMINATTGVITKIAGLGWGGYGGDGGPALTAQLDGPQGMAFDAAGNLYFADTYNYRIRKITVTAQPAAAPVFSIAAGAYNAAQTVAITDTTPNAVIYYTTDGSTPTTSSTVYSGPITVSSSVTINALAAAIGYNNSAIATASYVISVQAPVPSLSILSPAVATAGGAAFTLTVNGSGFTSASVMYWNSTALATQYVSDTQLTAQVAASSIASAGIASITVQTPAPGGGTSNAMKFEVDSAGSTPPTFSTPSVTVSAGGTATYSVALSASASNISVTCLNLPAGATCSYSAGTLSITTSSTTPAGSYVITAVFTQTLPGAALILLPFLLMPAADRRRRKVLRIAATAFVVLLIAMVATGSGCGGGGGSTPPPQTHQVTSSAPVTLIVK